MKSFMLASVIASAGAAGTLKLAYQDCGATHGKVTGLSPNTLTLGQRTTVTGSGSVDEAVTDGTFEMNIKASILSKTCTGNICQPSTCPLPAGVGSITWNGMKCPLAKGDVTVGTDVILSGALPPWAARATIGIKGKASNGDDLLCMTLSTAPAEVPIVIQQSHSSPALPEQHALSPATQITSLSNRAQGCDPYSMWGCGTALIGAIAACGEFNFGCLQSILGAVPGCMQCLCSSMGCPQGCPCMKDMATTFNNSKSESADVNANSIIDGNDNFNGHDNGVNVNVNVLGIQDKEDIESGNGGNIHGDGNMNGHDNGVNVNVNVLGVQVKKNVESAANVTIDGKNNSNGHDNGVNVDVNVYGVQMKEDGGQLKEDNSTWSMVKALSSLFGFTNGGTLKLAYQDCGAAHGKVTGLSPSTLTLGQKTTVTGSGSVDEAVTDGTFEMNIKASILSKTCTGNICQPSTCPLPAGVGSITWNGMKCPLAKGDVTVGTDVILSGALPPWAARATIGIKGKASNGDDLLCMTLSTAPAEASAIVV